MPAEEFTAPVIKMKSRVEDRLDEMRRGDKQKAKGVDKVQAVAEAAAKVQAKGWGARMRRPLRMGLRAWCAPTAEGTGVAAARGDGAAGASRLWQVGAV